MNRIQLQGFSEERVRDAEALLNAGQWSGAYYLAGYAIECGLKSCIAKMINEHDYPDRNLVLKAYTHNIEELVQVAGVKDQRKAELDSDPKSPLAKNWAIVKDWKETSRYQTWTEAEARILFTAVSDTNDGVLTWIKDRW